MTTIRPPRARYRVALLVREDMWSAARELFAKTGVVLKELDPVSPNVQRFDVTIRAAAKPVVTDDGVVLTPRELEVLSAVSRGVSTVGIAAELFVSYDTVKTHLRNLFKKLGVGDRAHAVSIAYQRGILGGAR